MKILAADTSANVATVCVVQDGKLLAERVVDYKKTHSQTLMPMIDGVLADCGSDIAEIDLFAVANGPGSFTGLRIGVSTIKGMAHASGKPVAEISTLEALAHNVYMTDAVVCPIMDARRSQVYNAIYEWEDGELEPLVEPRTVAIEDCVADAAGFERKIIFVGDGVPVHREYIEKTLGDMAVFAPPSCNSHRASSVAVLACRNEACRKSCYEVTPVYLRKPQAERELEERSKKEC